MYRFSTPNSLVSSTLFNKPTNSQSLKRAVFDLPPTNQRAPFTFDLEQPTNRRAVSGTSKEL